MLRIAAAALATALFVQPAAAAPATRSSAQAQLDAGFTHMDANKDGVLTRAEVSARVNAMQINGRPLTAEQKQAMTALWFGRADANKDGRITRAEARSVLTRVFDRFDLNHDGVVTPAEQQAALAAARQEGMAARRR